MMETVHVLAGIGYILIGIYAIGVGLIDLFGNIYDHAWWAIPRSLLIIGCGVALLSIYP